MADEQQPGCPGARVGWLASQTLSVGFIFLYWVSKMRTLRNPSVILILSDPALNSKPASSFTATLLRCCFCLFRVRGALFSIQSPRPDQRRVSRSPASPKTMRFGLRGLCSLELAQALCCCPSPSFAVAQPRPPLLAPWRGIFSRIPSMITHLRYGGGGLDSPESQFTTWPVS